MANKFKLNIVIKIANKKNIIWSFIRNTNFFEALILIAAMINLKIVKDIHIIMGYLVAPYLESTFFIKAKEEIQPSVPVYYPN